MVAFVRLLLDASSCWFLFLDQLLADGLLLLPDAFLLKLKFFGGFTNSLMGYCCQMYLPLGYLYQKIERDRPMFKIR